jgi:hypothetical protein
LSSDSTHLVREIEDGGGDDIVIPGLPTRFTHEEMEDMHDQRLPRRDGAV